MSPVELSDVQVVILESLVKPEDAHAVLWHFGERAGAREPGSFTQSLVDTIARADPINRQRLSYGFPGLVAAVNLIQGHASGIARLQHVAGIASDVDTGEIPVIRDEKP